MRAICFDEISLHRGHGKFVLVISAPELGLVLDVLPDRNKETLLKWLEERGIEWCAAVQFACSDMWDAYQQAAKQKLPNARRVVDRFHIMKNLNEALTKARRTIQKDAEDGTWEIVFYHKDYWFWLSGLTSVVVRKDQKVKAGDILGHLETGKKIELLLYDFETPIDPKKYLKCGK